MGIPVDNQSVPMPNQGGDREHGSDPTARHPSAVRRPPLPHTGGTADLAGHASPVRPADHRFDVNVLRSQKSHDHARGSATAPGRGAIPIQPTADGGAAADLRMGRRGVK